MKTLARTVRGTFKRIQFTPDLVPADLVGTRIYNQKTGEFATSLGPVFTNLLLADEINRAPAKVQSALLEVMQERQVTIAGETHKVPEPFLVMATQNPIETEGTYPLPEAQVDRFMMKVLVGYPSEEEEFVIVERVTGAPADGQRRSRPPSSSPRCSANAARVYVDPSLMQYAVQAGRARRATPTATASPTSRKYLTFGASPRATINLIEGARALAFLRGRNYVLPEDMTDLVPDVLRHRLVLSYEALAEALTADALDPARSCSSVAARPTSRWRHACPTSRAARAESAPAPARMDGDPPSRRAAAGRLPHAVPRLRPRPRRPARVPAPRRRAPHRLERHRAAADAVRARVQRGPRGHRLVPARPEPVASTSARRACSKRAVSAEFVTVLARLLTRHGNRVGALFYGDEVDTVIPARSGRRHVLHLLHAHARRARAARASRRDRPRRAAAQPRCDVIQRRSLVFVVSDFISAPGWAEPLAQLAQRHEVIAVRLYDPLEMELPDLGLLVDPGRRDRRAAVRRHPRPRLPQALRRRGRAARERAARRRSRAPASTRSSSPPTTTWSTRSCASPTCASGAASSRPAAACRMHLREPEQP